MEDMIGLTCSKLTSSSLALKNYLIKIFHYKTFTSKKSSQIALICFNAGITHFPFRSSSTQKFIHRNFKESLSCVWEQL